MYHNNQIEVPKKNSTKAQILRSQHNIDLARHPVQSKILSLVLCSFTWPSQKAYMTRDDDGCDSCQKFETITQKLFRTLKPLPTPAGPWRDISHDLITGTNFKCVQQYTESD